MPLSGLFSFFFGAACSTIFSETRDTVFFDLRTPDEQVMLALKLRLVQVSLSDISFILGVTAETGETLP